jgi:hypothetical protein
MLVNNTNTKANTNTKLIFCKKIYFFNTLRSESACYIWHDLETIYK